MNPLHSRHEHSIGLSRLLLWGFAALAVVLAAQNVPDLIRYFKIRSM